MRYSRDFRARQPGGRRTLEAMALSALRRNGASLWGVPKNGGGLFTDSAGTVSANATGDVLGRVNDQAASYAAIQATQSFKPVIGALANGRRGMLFGGDDLLTADNPLQYATDHWVCIGAVFDFAPSVGAPQMPYCSGNATGAAGRAELRFDPTMRVVWVDNSGSSFGAGATTFTPTVGVPFVGFVKKIGNSFSLRANGTQIASSSLPSSLTLTTTKSCIGVSLRPSGNFGFFRGQIVVAQGQNTITDSDMQLIEKYLSSLIGGPL